MSPVLRDVHFKCGYAITFQTQTAIVSGEHIYSKPCCIVKRVAVLKTNCNSNHEGVYAITATLL